MKKILITGAAGGLGKAVIRRFAREGFYIIAADLILQGMEEFEGNDNILLKKLDVTDLNDIQSFTDDLGEKVEELDVFASLAGVYDFYPVTEGDPELFLKILSVNLFGTAFMIRQFLHPLIKKRGKVIVVSSESYKVQALFQPYMISKAALESYCHTARQELSLKGVSLSVIRPGAIRTPLLDWMNAGPAKDKYPVFERELEKSWQESIKMVGRLTAPERVADKIYDAANASKPKFVYRVNNNPLLTLAALIPAGIRDRIIIRKFRKKS